MTPRQEGNQTRREVLGDAHVDRAEASVTSFNADFQDFITRYAWGEIWTRPGLDRHVRRLVTIAMLAALGRDEELDMHIRAALDDGVTAEELSELLMHVGVYAGLPAANRAFTIAGRTLAERESTGRGDT
ncbi:4-carboxymuconolactone decarboxylase [Stackebrandtia nassauensis]|uniref:4-carboxymuconolactone decarboxylase n=1 Tax=Stackebrandtia nassauensis (strain DSM 44728 / CIP 108903 / NRRL B-16338 / NBRC 102104 / LLR-40K-21) TaxID=446470 RepID=D3Q3G8_STANL|nr:4-carboxymuconolactone decarboxylase [Stackebrandtia nassauensis]ADD42009.1 4-carboxymuconolactone decarboxylase [Stackebrandtia nassauensis DSM 44728]